MKRICRISIPNHPTKSQEEVLGGFMIEAGVVMTDIYTTGRPDRPGEVTHYGNWVLTPVLDNEATDRLCKAMGNEKDFKFCVPEYDDFTNWHVGDSVSIGYMSDWSAGKFAFDGRIVRKTMSADEGKAQIEVLKLGSATKGKVVRVGDNDIISIVVTPKKAGAK